MLSRFTLGDTLSLTKSLPDYPATAGWVLSVRLLPRSHGGAAIEFSAAAAGADHVVTVPAATTAAWAAGTYSWASWVSDGTSTHSIEQGTADLLLNPRTASGPIDMRSAAEVSLDNVRATIQGKASADVLKYEINGRSLERYPMRDLIELESHLASQVAREKRQAQLAAGKADPRRYAVRLGRA